jgi:hypothetical protein
VYAFNVGFYALPFSAKVGYTAAFSTLAAINAVALVPLLGLFWIGERIRLHSVEHQG